MRSIVKESAYAIWIVGCFFGSVLGARAWFHTSPERTGELIRLSSQTNLIGWQYIAEPLSPVALDMLEDPECLNGTFVPNLSQRNTNGSALRVFCARWGSKGGHGLTVLQHTPDICWVGAGWKPVDAGQSRQLTLSVRNARPDPTTTDGLLRKIPFECRAFRSGDQRNLELVVWCTIVGGRVIPESKRFSVGTAQKNDRSNMDEAASAGRRLTASYFAKAVAERLRTHGTKQFVRVSTPIEGSTSDALSRLQSFLSQFLISGPFESALQPTD